LRYAQRRRQRQPALQRNRQFHIIQDEYVPTRYTTAQSDLSTRTTSRLTYRFCLQRRVPPASESATTRLTLFAGVVVSIYTTPKIYI
ncbi:hypothetical protein ASPTUDRAFT_174249, partial [Aspergillus tubingensis CBS 134.48]